ncbi:MULTISPECIES: YlbL family protein [Pseudonocardia]|uniref:endopeptidase La n=1 Tax=Pseudonocardia autotrophica TaxID=2074 RepID=A0A1Y2N4X9_PSEAH|nr:MULTISPECIES: PDZ domain-containing protein [Pseudonocardia]OSY42532.1 DNA-binding ATP-dependent protease La [Pseudonocardia autotrophica]TDN76051.1 PDZ domain-containing protein [Pseudonocardia autotrophica]
MGLRSSTWLTALLVLLGLTVVGSVVPAPVVALGPGPTFDTLGDVDGTPVVSAEGLPTYPTEGHLNMTTVGVTDGITTIRALGLWASGTHRLAPRSSLYPPGRSTDEVTAENQQEFDSSIAYAEAAALNHLGLPTRVTVGTLTDDSPSAGVLEVGDEIRDVGGAPVTSVQALLDALAGTRPGEPLALTISRDGGAPREVTVTPAPHPSDPERAFLGITPATTPADGQRLSITLGDVGGPSAGLMFSLALVDKLTPGPLTGGRFVAGTGTINAEGQVGPISGIRFKMIKAQEVGAETFLVPAANCAEAASDAPDGLQLVRVGTLDEAVGALETLDAGGTPASCTG